jgi:hypothetical protein
MREGIEHYHDCIEVSGWFHYFEAEFKKIGIKFEVYRKDKNLSMKENKKTDWCFYFNEEFYETFNVGWDEAESMAFCSLRAAEAINKIKKE